ncbi:hypothetical protein BB559_006224, partial [Furculomyces boomerangus]
MGDIPKNNNPFRASEIRYPDVERFDGKPENFDSFAASLEIQFWSFEAYFSIDRNKISYIGSHLKESASLWFQSLIGKNSDSLNSYTSFKTVFTQRFSSSSSSLDAITRTKQCRQGTR